jgi:2-methylisocitrate lyase-like PEP mutase family enzyme
MNEFRGLLTGTEPVLVPLVFNPISAKLAEAVGFRALYLGGGSMQAEVHRTIGLEVERRTVER